MSTLSETYKNLAFIDSKQYDNLFYSNEFKAIVEKFNLTTSTVQAILENLEKTNSATLERKIANTLSPQKIDDISDNIYANLDSLEKNIDSLIKKLEGHLLTAGIAGTYSTISSFRMHLSSLEHNIKDMSSVQKIDRTYSDICSLERHLSSIKLNLPSLEWCLPSKANFSHILFPQNSVLACNSVNIYMLEMNPSFANEIKIAKTIFHQEINEVHSNISSNISSLEMNVFSLKMCFSSLERKIKNTLSAQEIDLTHNNVGRLELNFSSLEGQIKKTNENQNDLFNILNFTNTNVDNLKKQNSSLEERTTSLETSKGLFYKESALIINLLQDKIKFLEEDSQKKDSTITELQYREEKNTKLMNDLLDRVNKMEQANTVSNNNSPFPSSLPLFNPIEPINLDSENFSLPPKLPLPIFVDASPLSDKLEKKF